MNQVPARQDLDKELISRVAMDIGKEMVAYIECMYPDVYDTMNSGCKLSIRNHIHNDIMAVLKFNRAETFEAWLEDRKNNRREWLKQNRLNRKLNVHFQRSRDKV